MFIHKNTIIISDDKFIYYGKIFGDKIEIINNVDAELLLFFSLEYKYIFYNKTEKGKNKNFKKIENDDEIDEDEDEYD